MSTDPSIITFHGKNAEETVVTVMAGVHGNEICGLEAVRKALREIETGKLQILRGTVHFIFANLPGIALGVRQTQMNLNRAFKTESEYSEDQLQSYERRRALELMPFLEGSDALLDIHSSFTEESVPFIICEPHSFMIAERLNFPIRSHGWDIIEAGGTDYYVNRNQKHGRGICIECGWHLDPKAPERAFESLLTFLQIMRVIDNVERPIPAPRSQRVVFVPKIHITKTNFRPAKKFSDFEKIQNGELIGYDGDVPIFSPDDHVIIFARPRERAGEEAFILGVEKPASS